MAASQRASSYTVLVFDPGLSNTGWAVLELKAGDNRALIVNTGLIQLTREVRRVSYRPLTDVYGIRVITLNMLEDELVKLFATYKPDFVVTEDVFFDPHRITASAALLQWITILERYALKQKLRVYRIAARTAKKTMTGVGDASKTSIQETVLANPNIRFRHRSALPDLSEHEADAIAIGWHFFENIFPEAVQVLLPMITPPTAA